MYNNPTDGKKYSFIIYVVAFFIIYLLSEILKIRVSFKQAFDWWEQHNGKTFDFSLFNMYAGYESGIGGRILYYLSKLNTSAVNTLSISQIIFFVNNVLKYQYYVDSNGNEQGILLPVHVCKSAKLAKGQGIPGFDTWYTNMSKNDRPYDNEKNNNGLYPGIGDTLQWKNKIANWCGMESDSFWVSMDHDDGNLYPTKVKAEEWNKEWQNTVKHQDNFLARTGMSPDSPLIISFINNTYDLKGLKIDARAFKNLIGDDVMAPNLGGWVGYMISMGEQSPDDYSNYLYTQLKIQPNPPPNSCGGGTAGDVAAWGQGIGAATGIGAMVPMVAASGPFAPIVLGIAAIGVGTASIASHYMKKGECGKK